MCSVCWEWNPKDQPDKDSRLLVIFNRDEQRSRAIAKPPELVSLGGGTWISGNEHGVVIALLNLYSVTPDPDKIYASRGQLVKALSNKSNPDQISAKLSDLTETENYPAFSLIIWDTRALSHRLFQWDESNLTELSQKDNFYTSSSWNTEEVQQFRRNSYQELALTKAMSLETFMHHVPASREKWSVFMEREATQTVSSTSIKVTNKTLSMNYYDRNSSVKSSSSLNLINSSVPE